MELLSGHPECIRCELGVHHHAFEALILDLQEMGYDDLSCGVSPEEQLSIFLYASVTRAVHKHRPHHGFCHVGVAGTGYPQVSATHCYTHIPLACLPCAISSCAHLSLFPALTPTLTLTPSLMLSPMLSLLLSPLPRCCLSHHYSTITLTLADPCHGPYMHHHHHPCTVSHGHIALVLPRSCVPPSSSLLSLSLSPLPSSSPSHHPAHIPLPLCPLYPICDRSHH